MSERWMVYRYSPKMGDCELMLPHGFSAHSCLSGQKLGLLPEYATKAEALADAARLERYVNDGCCLYAACRIDPHPTPRTIAKIERKGNHISEVREMVPAQPGDQP